MAGAKGRRRGGWLGLALLAGMAACEDRNEGARDPGPFDGAAPTPDARVIADGALPPGDGALADQGPLEWDSSGQDAAALDASTPDAATDAGAADAASDAFVDPDDGVPVDPVCVAPEPVPVPGDIDLAARCRGRGEPLRIRDLRDRRCPDYRQLPTQRPGIDIEIREAIVTGVYGNDFAVQDPEGGPHSGMWVFLGGRAAPGGVRPGARVRLRGEMYQFYELAELVPLPQRQDGIEVLGDGPVPEPLFVSDPARIADGGDLQDVLESVLVEVRDVRVTNTAPDCPGDFGMFVVSGGLRVDDEAPFDYEPARRDVLRRLTGVVHHSFDHAKILPRGDADLDVVTCGGIPDKCEGAACPVEPDAEETGALVITELQINPIGEDRFREWVELHNPGPDAIDLTGWVLQDCGGHQSHLAGDLPPGGFHLRVADLDERRNGGVEDADGGMGELFLPNGYGSVLVFDADGLLVDQVRYQPSDGWPRRDTGETLEIIDPALDNRLGDSWRAGRGEYGPGGSGSPGRLGRR